MANGRASVFVAGGAGYVGSHVVLALLDAGHKVVVLDSLTSGQRDSVDSRASFIEGTVENRSLVRAMLEMHGVEVVVHAAGTPPDDQVASDPLALYRANAGTTQALAESVVACGVGGMVHVSTSLVHAPLPLDAGAAVASIALAEQILREAARFHGFGLGILRLPEIAGTDPAGRAGPVGKGGAGLIRRSLQVALGQRSHVGVPVAADASGEGGFPCDFLHVSDAAAAVLALVESLLGGDRRCRTFTCGNGQGHSSNHVIDLIERITKVRLVRRAESGPVGMVADGAGGIAVLRDELGWQPRLSDLEHIVRDAYRREMELLRAMPERAAIAETTELRLRHPG